MSHGVTGQNIHVTRFALGERIYLVDAEVYGRIKEIRLATGSIEYLVAYFDDDKCRRNEWFAEDELRRVERNSTPADSE